MSSDAEKLKKRRRRVERIIVRASGGKVSVVDAGPIADKLMQRHITDDEAFNAMTAAELEVRALAPRCSPTRSARAAGRRRSGGAVRQSLSSEGGGCRSERAQRNVRSTRAPRCALAWALQGARRAPDAPRHACALTFSPGGVDALAPSALGHSETRREWRENCGASESDTRIRSIVSLPRAMSAFLGVGRYFTKRHNKPDSSPSFFLRVAQTPLRPCLRSRARALLSARRPASRPPVPPREPHSHALPRAVGLFLASSCATSRVLRAAGVGVPRSAGRRDHAPAPRRRRGGGRRRRRARAPRQRDNAYRMLASV